MTTFDVGIIVALREEFRELFNQLPNPEAVRDEETGVTDYIFQWGCYRPYRCAATFVGGMGPEKAALATERFIGRCQPRTIVMLGIAGGIDRDVKLGDVVVVATANNYLSEGKAVPGQEGSFSFEVSGDTYRCSDDLVRAVQDLEFAHRQLYQDWQEGAKTRREAELSPKLLQEGWLGEKPEFIVGAIASGPVVGAAKSFTDWLKRINRKYLALEMEGAGMLSAVYSRSDPQKTLILRGISDFGDERKKDLDEIGKGGVRRYAMNNTIHLLWKLLEAQILPQGEGKRVDHPSPPDGIDGDELLDILKKLIPAQFNELVWKLRVPDEYLPSKYAPQTERAIALLDWASAPGGIGSIRVREALGQLIQKPELGGEGGIPPKKI